MIFSTTWFLAGLLTTHSITWELPWIFAAVKFNGRTFEEFPIKAGDTSNLMKNKNTFIYVEYWPCHDRWNSFVNSNSIMIGTAHMYYLWIWGRVRLYAQMKTIRTPFLPHEQLARIRTKHTEKVGVDVQIPTNLSPTHSTQSLSGGRVCWLWPTIWCVRACVQPTRARRAHLIRTNAHSQTSQTDYFIYRRHTLAFSCRRRRHRQLKARVSCQTMPSNLLEFESNVFIWIYICQCTAADTDECFYVCPTKISRT